LIAEIEIRLGVFSTYPIIGSSTVPSAVGIGTAADPRSINNRSLSRFGLIDTLNR